MVEKRRVKRDKDESIPSWDSFNVNEGEGPRGSLDKLFFFNRICLLCADEDQVREPRQTGGGFRANDPMFKAQWHLNGGARGGFDMNVKPAWDKGFTGKGVVVTILDDGIQTNHPELRDNYDPQVSNVKRK